MIGISGTPAAVLAAAIMGLIASPPAAAAQAPRAATPDPVPLSALAPPNLARPRPAAPVNFTGNWLIDMRSENSWHFVPPTFKLTPSAQAHYDASRKAIAEGKVYHDDIGQCWPAGVPLIMSRVWPIAAIQIPTAVYMISGFMNSMRIIYLDGRAHTDPDVVVRSFNGESIGRWEGETLVVDTRHFVADPHRWIDQGIPASDELHIVERMRLVNDGKALEIAYTMTDPKNWEGDWKITKRWNRVDDQDIQEVECLPDLNQHMPSTQSKDNVR